MRILIVDDDPISLAMLENALQQHGYEVVCANNGLEALEIVRAGEIRMIISDWMMPEMSGVELCRAVRAEGMSHYVYFVLLTSRSEAHAVEGLDAGADEYLTKPFEPGELLARVRAARRVLSLETRDVTIFALAKLAESRDPETGAHIERVQNYARTLATELHRRGEHADQVDAEYIRLIYSTSPLHDIGKVAIPDCVLLKPGRLTDREFDIMKTHASAGAMTLENALHRFPEARFLRVARDIAAAHHERWDGSGYPRGLVGEDIPLAGRIVALADVYDALVSRRVYKDAFNPDIARAIILDETGKQFDPAVIEAFKAQEDTFLEILHAYQDSPPQRAASA